ANPDASNKVTNPAGEGTGTPQANGLKVVEIHEHQSPEGSATRQPGNPGGTGTGAKPGAAGISDRWGNTVVTDGTMTLKKVPPQPGQERDVINKGLPITNKDIDRTE